MDIYIISSTPSQAIQQSSKCHFLLKCLCQVRKVSRRIFGSGDIDFASFLDFILRIWNCFDIVVLFALHLSMNASHSFISIMV